MIVAILDPLEGRLQEFPARYLPGHEVLLAPEPGRLPEGVSGAEALVWWSHPVDAKLLDSVPRLRFLQRVGYFRASGDVTAALRRGIPVSATPFGVSDRVAQHALALTLALIRQLLPSHQGTLEARNPDNMPPEETGAPANRMNWPRIPGIASLNDKTVGILGFGEIGACYARLLAPFACDVLYYKRRPLTPDQEQFYGARYAPLDDVLAAADVVASFVPYTPESRRMLGAREFGLMKPSAYFVNCGRGNTVDESALIEVLQARRIAGAGLDVFAIEPLPAGSPLTKLDNVVLTPHSAGGVGGWEDTFQRLAANLRRVEAGRPVIMPLAAEHPMPG